MTTSPSIRATALPARPLGDTSGAVATAQDGPSDQDNRNGTQDQIAVTADQAEMLWHAKQARADGNDVEHQRIQRQVAALALDSAPTIRGREAVLRQMESLRHGLNEQGVALVTRKAAVTLEATALSLTGRGREAALLRVF
ncbi:MAG: hypothetical protein HYU59_14710 [Magnetospirillum gryphiswaldense]|nr:hypothetical protein [Magnetospirillum gryphiswaldense]